MLNPDDYIFVGKIGRTTGTDGSLTIIPMTSFPERFKELDEVFLTRIKSVPKTCKVTKVLFHKEKIIMKLEGIDSIEEAEKLKDYRVTIHKDDKFELPKDYYYISDLTECIVFDQDDNELGQVKEVMEMASNDIYIVDYKGEDLLIPAISQFVQDIDIENKKIVVSLIDGMLPDMEE